MSDLPRARDIMRNDFIRLSERASVRDAMYTVLQELRLRDVPSTCVLLSSNRRFGGLVPVYGILERFMESGAERDDGVLDLVRMDGAAIGPDDSLRSVLKAVLLSESRAAPVLEDGVLMGVIFQEDVFDHLAEAVLAQRSRAAGFWEAGYQR